MHPDHDTSIIPPIHDDPEAHAHDVVEAMRANGTLTPEIERALVGVGKAHVRILAKIVEPERPQ